MASSILPFRNRQHGKPRSIFFACFAAVLRALSGERLFSAFSCHPQHPLRCNTVFAPGIAQRVYASFTIRRMCALSQTALPDLNAEMVTIPAGFFLMGSATGQDNERPFHRVWL